MNEIVKSLKALDGKYRYDQIFFDWVHVMAYVFSNIADFNHFDEREKEYFKIKKKYDERTMDVFGECMAILIDLFEKEGISDYLGTIYHLLNLHNSNKGQFFTPYALSLASAETLIDKKFLEKTIAESGYVKIGENACGAGSMILAQLQVFNNFELNYQKTAKIECCDLDENVLLMCYVQLSILGARATCYVGNALSKTVYSEWITPSEWIWRLRLFGQVPAANN